ncbi:hypothetical protein [Pseudomonas sp. ERMR1:02]|uniref:hypothetical protein n=1 Tax=unclassified Pseudomonas TaxID=196821 RepID=UPI0035311C32
MQREWIGRTEGVDIDFKVLDKSNTILTVFTGEPEALYGVNAIFLSDDNLYVKNLLRNSGSYVQSSISLMLDPKNGVDGFFLNSLPSIR